MTGDLFVKLKFNGLMSSKESYMNQGLEAENPATYYKVVWMLPYGAKRPKHHKDGHEERGLTKEAAEVRVKWLEENEKDPNCYTFMVEVDSTFESDCIPNKIRR